MLRPSDGRNPVETQNDKYTPKTYMFDVTKCDEIFDLLVADGQVAVPNDLKVSPLEQRKKRGFCKYHKFLGHKTSHCVLFRDLVQRGINEGMLKFGDKTLVGMMFMASFSTSYSDSLVDATFLFIVLPAVDFTFTLLQSFFGPTPAVLFLVLGFSTFEGTLGTSETALLGFLVLEETTFPLLLLSLLATHSHHISCLVEYHMSQCHQHLPHSLHPF